MAQLSIEIPKWPLPFLTCLLMLLIWFIPTHKDAMKIRIYIQINQLIGSLYTVAVLFTCNCRYNRWDIYCNLWGWRVLYRATPSARGEVGFYDLMRRTDTLTCKKLCEPINCSFLIRTLRDSSLSCRCLFNYFTENEASFVYEDLEQLPRQPELSYPFVYSYRFISINRISCAQVNQFFVFLY